MTETLLRDTSLLFPDWSPFETLPDTDGLLDTIAFGAFTEQWTADTVTLTAQVELDATHSFDLFGFDCTFGDPTTDVTTATLTVELDSEPVVTAIAVLLLGANLATARDLTRAVGALGVDQMTEQELDAARTAYETSADEWPDLGRIRAELADVSVQVALPAETFQAGQLRVVDGDVVGIEPHPDDPPVAFALGDVVLFADSAEGVGIDVQSPDSVSVPPLLFRGTQVGFELRDVLADFSETSTPEPLASAPGYDSAWRGLYVGELTVWGLQSLLPCFPEGLDSGVADGTRLTATEWVVDHHGFAGAITYDPPDSAARTGLWHLDQMTVAFDRGWVPETLSAVVDLELARLHDEFTAVGDDGTVQFGVELRYDPERPPAARFGFDVVARATEDGPLLDLRGPELADAKTELYTALAGLAVAGGPGPTTFLGALAALEGEGMLTTDRVSVENLDVSYDTEQVANGVWQSVLSLAFDLAAEFTLQVDEADLNTPLGLKARSVRVDYVTNHATLAEAGISVDPVTVEWDLDEIAVSLQPDANVGTALSISDVTLRLTDDEFLVELGVETEGDGDVVLSGIPDAIVIAVDGEGTVDVRLGGNVPVTLLVPGVLYARGELASGADAVGLPPAGDGLSWDGAVAGSVRGFLVGNGTAATPADHTRRASYLFGLDLGLLSATRSDGMATVVLSLSSTFSPGIPLGTSGIGVYGLGLVYAQNARPALPAPDDYAGWYMDESPKYTTHATKWEPALDEWGFGASTVVGSAPDDGRSWSAKVGLIVLLPGPVIILAGTGDTFSERPTMGGGDAPPFAAVVVLDFEDEVFTLDLQVSLDIPSDPDSTDLVTVELPVELFVNLDDASDFRLYMGRYAPPEARVVAEALGMLDLSAYLMLDGSPIRGLPTVDPLPGLALALGGEASVDWGLKSSVLSVYVYADAGFHLGISLADPPLLAGLVRLEGGLVVKVFGFGFDLGVYAQLAGIAPDPFSLSGEVGVDIGLPWPFDDIHTSVSMTFGSGGALPDAPNPFVDCHLHPRGERTTLSLTEANDGGETPTVPVDPVFALTFDSPINGVGPVGSFTALTVDGGADVWSVVTTEQTSDEGIERQHRLGYRYELVECTVTNVETGETVTDAPATWTPGGDAASSDGAAPAAGGQPARTSLLLFTHEATYLNRTVGVGGELSKRQTAAWDPCTRKKTQTQEAYDATGLAPGDDLSTPRRLSLVHRDVPGDPPVWARTVSEASPAARRFVDSRLVRGGVVVPPYDSSTVPFSPLQRDRVVAVPQLVARSQTGLTTLQQLASGRFDPAALSHALDVVLPAHEHAELRLLVAEGVHVVAVGLVDGDPATDPLALTPIGDSFGLQGLVDGTPQTDGEWQLVRCTPPHPVDAVRLLAIRPPSLEHVPPPLDEMAASVLSVVLKFGDADGSDRERDTLTALVSDLVDAKQRGVHLDMLEPGSTYDLTVTVEATHAEQWDTDPVERGASAGSFSSTFSFQTAADPPSRLRGTDDPDPTRDEWDLAVTPQGSLPHYTDDAASIRFRSDRTLSTYAAYGDALALRLVDEYGVDQFEHADAVEARAADLPAETAVWRSTLESLHCVDDADELWREATAPIRSLLSPETRYTATLHAVDEQRDLATVAWDATPPVYSWRFVTSRWPNADEHLAAHAPIDELTDVLPSAAALHTATAAAVGTASAGLVVDDHALDHLLFDVLGLPPRRPPSDPELVRVWRWNPATDAAEPVALLFDGPEPLLRDDTLLTIRQGARQCAGRVVTGVSRARVLFVADAGELSAGDPLDVRLSPTGRRLAVSLPTRPSVLTTSGGSP